MTKLGSLSLVTYSQTCLVKVWDVLKGHGIGQEDITQLGLDEPDVSLLRMRLPASLQRLTLGNAITQSLQGAALQQACKVQLPASGSTETCRGRCPATRS